MSRIVFIIFCFFSFTKVQSITAQVKAPNSIYIEVVGNGGFYSVNYDRLLCNYFGFRIGGSYIHLGDIGQYATFPIMMNLFIGTKHHKLEIGAGYSIMYSAVPEDFTIGSGTDYFKTVVLGYRYQTKGSIFRIGFTPLFTGYEVIPLGGISFGYAF